MCVLTIMCVLDTQIVNATYLLITKNRILAVRSTSNDLIIANV